jgi:hypothetical protein
MSELDVINKTAAPICCHLRSKGMFVNGAQEDVASGMPGTGDGYFWCLKTMYQFGPDNELVNRHVCTPSRSCFETI